MDGVLIADRSVKQASLGFLKSAIQNQYIVIIIFAHNCPELTFKKGGNVAKGQVVRIYKNLNSLGGIHEVIWKERENLSKRNN